MADIERQKCAAQCVINLDLEMIILHKCLLKHMCRLGNGAMQGSPMNNYITCMLGIGKICRVQYLPRTITLLASYCLCGKEKAVVCQ